jgi:hypothetical protein
MNCSGACSCNHPERSRGIPERHLKVNIAGSLDYARDDEDEEEFDGWVTERSIVHAWKACVPQGTRGSNPLPSVSVV